MIPEFLQYLAALYVSGALTAREREEFDLIVEFHDELRALVSELSEVAAKVALSMPGKDAVPPARLKGRILDMLDSHPQDEAPLSLVMSDSNGRVQWVNAAFSAMCGYTLEELRGKKLGPILQGEKTDRESAARLRGAVAERRACRESLVNYHKDGTPYWVDIAITPIRDDSDNVLYLVAREHEIRDRTVA